MKCEECLDLIAEYTLGSLTPTEREAVQEHLESGCVGCQRVWKEDLAAWEAVATSTEPVEPPAFIKADLMARIRESTQQEQPDRWRPAFSQDPEPESVTTTPAHRSKVAKLKTWLPYLAATLAGILVGYSFTGQNASTQLARIHEEELREARRQFGDPVAGMSLVSLTSRKPGFSGRLVWDRIAGEIHVYAFDLGLPQPGEVFRMWLVTEKDSWVALGDLEPESEQVATGVFPLDPHAEKIRRVVITAGPADSPPPSEDPGDSVRLSGEIDSL